MNHNGETSIVLMTKAALMLSEANTVQKAKELKNLALTAAEWAKRKGLGKETVQYARTYALLAERRMGEILRATKPAKGTRGQLKGKNPSGDTMMVPPEDDAPSFASLGLTKKEGARAKKLAGLSDESFEALTKQEISLVGALGVHVSNASGENEWDTPAEYIEAARAVMGSIDTDPATNDEANNRIKATLFYTSETDGRDKEWRGNVWMNPPYAQPLIAEFCDALVGKHNSREFKQACVLVNNATETAWFQSILSVSDCVCFPVGRIKFIDKAGSPSGAPLQGQAILYLGNKAERFEKEFSKFGPVLWTKI